MADAAAKKGEGTYLPSTRSLATRSCAGAAVGGGCKCEANRLRAQSTWWLEVLVAVVINDFLSIHTRALAILVMRLVMPSRIHVM